MAGVYIHIPFCKRVCGYCDFFKSVSLAAADDMHAAILREISSEARFIADKEISTVYFGGGTPTVYGPDRLQAIIDSIAGTWDCSSLAEVTLEANPDDLSEEYVSRLRTTGINRLSIGIQSLHDDELRKMNRRHDAAQAVSAVKRAQDAGFDNITVDLIYGLPFSDAGRWESTLQGVCELDVQHISAYHLTIESGTAFGRRAARGEISAVSEEESERQYAILHRMLTSGGYEHYEVSNFARKGFRSRHNSGYWTGEHYLGVGPAAHSFNGEVRRWAAGDIGRYLSGADIYELETLSEEQKYDEYVMTSLRRAEGVDLRELERRFGAYKLQYFTRAAEKYVRSGLLCASENSYRVAPENFLLSDMIICDLFA